MKLSSLALMVIYIAAAAAINAVIALFSPGGSQDHYIYAAIIVAILSAVGRWLQEQTVDKPEVKVVTSTIATADGNTTTRTRAVQPPVVETKEKNPLRDALVG